MQRQTVIRDNPGRFGSAIQSLLETSKTLQEHRAETDRGRVSNESQSRTRSKMEPGRPTVGRSPLLPRRGCFPHLSPSLSLLRQTQTQGFNFSKRLQHHIQDQTSGTLSQELPRGRGEDRFLTRELAPHLSVGSCLVNLSSAGI